MSVTFGRAASTGVRAPAAWTVMFTGGEMTGGATSATSTATATDEARPRCGGGIGELAATTTV